MALVFLALGLVVAAISLMGRYLRPDGRVAGAPPPSVADEDEPGRVAAMAVAIVLAKKQSEPGLSRGWRSFRELAAPSPWQAAHRGRALGRRTGRTVERGTGL
jgi:hypothetical protein